LTVLEKGRSKKRKAEEKENADPRKGAKVAKYWVFQRFEVSRVEKVEPEVAQSPFQNQHCQKKGFGHVFEVQDGRGKGFSTFPKVRKVRVFNYNRPLHQKILQYITPHCNSNCSTPSLQSTAQNTPTLQLHSSTVKIRPSGTSLLYITKTIPRYMTPHYTTTFYATALQLLHYKHSRKHFHSLHQTTLHKNVIRLHCTPWKFRIRPSTATHWSVVQHTTLDHTKFLFTPREDGLPHSIPVNKRTKNGYY
jgi:hypothetical protein